MTDDKHREEYRRHLLEQLNLLRREYEKSAQPYVKELVRLKATETPMICIDASQYESLQGLADQAQELGMGYEKEGKV